MEVQHGAVLGGNHDDTASEFEGTLSKWTNYILGWKSRFFVLKQGHLLYYKSPDDVRFGCRGAINLVNVNLVPHKLDECRFDLRFCDLFWYLRADSCDERQKWIEVLSSYIVAPNEPPDSTSCNKRWAVREKMEEIGTFKELILKQTLRLVDYFSDQFNVLETFQSLHCNDSKDLVRDLIIRLKENPVDLKEEIMTLIATVDALLSTATECVDEMDERELSWMKNEKSNARKYADRSALYTVGPELAEGQNCLLRDEEFYDAVEYGLERIEEEAELRKRLEDSLVDGIVGCEKESQHPLWSEIQKATEDQVELTCSAMNEDWTLLVDGDNMKMFTRDIVVNGVVVDPLKAVCTVEGVTGREICHYFYCPQFRKDWESTLEQMKVVEKIGDDTMVFHQVYKRVWPAAQRDLLFWSHLWRRETPGTHDVWAVVNKSIDLPQIPANDGKYVRVTLALCLLCVTETRPSVGKLSRDDVTCHLTYCSTVNPGGWVPASAIRALSRKEYPKFLNKFTSYVVEQTKHKEILL
ncbi:hypothetical protein GE061_010507 [Apolygus lucorum]|uniref:Ceramide transfer protein n=1 Tax=Apolygus lucorum TaxID=248454 RepID=A0A6A4J7E7_APOLU|nr:hypothetical protein GE061_010507 [Apolygus lucorum]